jgi:hypothetical protein
LIRFFRNVETRNVRIRSNTKWLGERDPKKPFVGVKKTPQKAFLSHQKSHIVIVIHKQNCYNELYVMCYVKSGQKD